MGAPRPGEVSAASPRSHSLWPSPILGLAAEKRETLPQSPLPAQPGEARPDWREAAPQSQACRGPGGSFACKWGLQASTAAAGV